MPDDPSSGNFGVLFGGAGERGLGLSWGAMHGWPGGHVAGLRQAGWKISSPPSKLYLSGMKNLFAPLKVISKISSPPLNLIQKRDEKSLRPPQSYIKDLFAPFKLNSIAGVSVKNHSPPQTFFFFKKRRFGDTCLPRCRCVVPGAVLGPGLGAPLGKTKLISALVHG